MPPLDPARLPPAQAPSSSSQPARVAFAGDYYRQLRARAAIEDVVRLMIPDRITSESGNKLLIDCPRHDSASGTALHVEVRLGVWYCFACGVGGDVIHLVEFIRFGTVSKSSKGQTTATHREARDLLAEYVGHPLLSKVALSDAEVAAREAEEAERVEVFAALTALQDHYHERLLSNPEMLAWVEKKYGFTKEAVERFKIGYADDGKGTRDALAKKGISAERLVSTGAFRIDSYERIQPFFEKRLVFPYTLADRCVYMIGRQTPRTEQSKYESGKYKKLPTYDAKEHPRVSKAIDNSVLWGEGILASRPKHILICEGITDAMAAVLAGFDVISPVTVRISEKDRDRILRALRGSTLVSIVLDNEISGVGLGAAIDMAHALDAADIESRIVVLPLKKPQKQARSALSKLLGKEVFAEIQKAHPERRKKLLEDAIAANSEKKEEIQQQLEAAKIDVCEFFRLGGTREEFAKLIDQGRDVFDVELDLIPGDDDSRGRAAALRRLLDYVRLQSPTLKDHFLKRIKRATGATIESLTQELAELDEEEEKKIQTAQRASGGSAVARTGPYRENERGLFVVTGETEEDIRQLTNFGARIVASVMEDDGVEQRRVLEVEAKLSKSPRTVLVPAPEFPSLSWVLEALGPEAIVFAGLSTKDHTRAAIQFLSHGKVRYESVYTHTGWREIEAAGWRYLHAGGALGPVGPVVSVRVSLPPPLAGMILPEPARGEALRVAFQGLRDFLDLGPRDVCFALAACVFRAVMGGTDFSMLLFGATQSFKTELAAIVQSFFGTGFTARNLPGSLMSTANANETILFIAKDMVCVMDDFVPGGSKSDIQRQQQGAERMLRSQGNTAGRARLASDTRLRAGRPPRGLTLMTCEELPYRHSARARSLVMEVEKGSVPSERLAVCQAHRDRGIYASLLAAMIQWIAPQYEAVRKRMRERFVELRDLAQADDRHRRTAAIVAELQVGFELLLGGALALEAVAKEEGDALRRECWGSLLKLAESQGRHHSAVEPASLFLRLLRAAFLSGGAHVTNREGLRPEQAAESLGWRPRETQGDVTSNTTWEPRGMCVGWVDGADAYLDPDAALKAAQDMASDSESIPVTATTLGKRLDEKGLLASTDKERGHNTVRKQRGGSRSSVFHLRLEVLLSSIPPAQPDHSAQNRASETGIEGDPTVGGPVPTSGTDARTSDWGPI